MTTGAPIAAEEPAIVLEGGWRNDYVSPIKRALLLDDDVYAEIAFGPGPLGRGFKHLLAILGVVVLGKVVGWLFSLLVMPRLGGVQTAIESFLSGMPWYANRVAQAPEYAQQFHQAYVLVWEGLRTLLGQPTPTSLISSILALIVTTLGAWLVYSALAQLLARWFGGEATFGQLAGTLALSYAPLLLLLVEIWPGAVVPVTLMFPLLLIFKYLAIRRTHGLSPAYTLATTLGPYVIGVVGLAFLSLFGLALGLNRIPIVSDLLQMGGRLPGLGF